MIGLRELPFSAISKSLQMIKLFPFATKSRRFMIGDRKRILEQFHRRKSAVNFCANLASAFGSFLTLLIINEFLGSSQLKNYVVLMALLRLGGIFSSFGLGQNLLKLILRET